MSVLVALNSTHDLDAAPFGSVRVDGEAVLVTGTELLCSCGERMSIETPTPIYGEIIARRHLIGAHREV